MNTVKLSLLFLCMIALTNISFAGQGGDGKKEEPECDYISVQTNASLAIRKN